jgi:nitrite reductase/ring-hydroxylating ferredoxin subunit
MNATSPCTGCFRKSSRREWIQRLAMSSTIYSALSGCLSPPTTRAASINPSERLQLDITAFPSLASSGGSAIVSYDGGLTNFLINRDTEFFAMDPTCPHERCQVNPYSMFTSTIVCPCHFAQFNIRGDLVSGPANTNLNTYATQFEEPSTLIIEVPGFVHRLDEIAVHSSSSGSTRMRLTFPTINGSLYKVRYSPDLSSPFEPIYFATTSAGVADQDLFEATGAPATVYVDTSGTTGFFTLELMVSLVAY